MLPHVLFAVHPSLCGVQSSVRRVPNLSCESLAGRCEHIAFHCLSCSPSFSSEFVCFFIFFGCVQDGLQAMTLAGVGAELINNRSLGNVIEELDKLKTLLLEQPPPPGQRQSFKRPLSAGGLQSMVSGGQALASPCVSNVDTPKQLDQVDSDIAEGTSGKPYVVDGGDDERDQFEPKQVESTARGTMKRRRSSSAGILASGTSSDQTQHNADTDADMPAGPRRSQRRAQAPATAAEPAAAATNDVDESAADRVQCPSCGISVSSTLINSHLDSCLNGAPTAKSSTAADCTDASGPTVPTAAIFRRGGSGGSEKQEPVKRMPGTVYNLLKDRALRTLVKKLGLPAQGDRARLEWRHREYGARGPHNMDCPPTRWP